MNLSEKIGKMKELESEIQRMVSELKVALVDAIAEQKMDGVNILNDGSNGGPHIATVMFSAVASSRGSNLSPEYYIPKAQADAVMHRIDSCSTASQICKAVEQMIAEKRVKKSGSSNDYVYLNEETLRIMKESELGRAASDGAEDTE